MNLPVDVSEEELALDEPGVCSGDPTSIVRKCHIGPEKLV